MPRVTIKKVQKMSPTTRLYSLEAHDASFQFLPGQYVSFLIPKKNNPPAIRPYSFCSSPSILPHFELCIREIPDGLATPYLRKHIGKAVEVSDAQGEFVLSEDFTKHFIFFASGVGVAPVRSILLRLFEQEKDARATLIYRYRSTSEYLFGSEFEKLGLMHEHFSFLPFEYSEYENKSEHALLHILKTPREQNVCFVVGPPSFVKSHTETLMRAGYNKNDIIIDIWE